TSPSAPTKPTFTATLLPANETPPIANAEASGNGTVTITMDTTTSGGNLTAASITFVANGQGFPAGTTVTAGPIHKGPAGLGGAERERDEHGAGQRIGIPRVVQHFA